MNKVFLYTDGACSGNPGPGGWACLLKYNEAQKEISGGLKETTNNQMELTAVIEGLSLLKKPCEVELFTDSKYVLEGATKWLNGWIQNGWKKADKKPVLNRELWEKLIPIFQKHTITWHWVKGHAGHPENERVDSMACIERDNHSNS